ncbi:MAG TPA: GvpL/GvpF family gas vesicle protein [Solirubrobacteraceae bacterium]
MSSLNLPDENLRQALRAVAAADVPAVLDRARTRAVARAERLIEEALLEQLLDAAAELRSSAGSEPTGDTHHGPRTQADEGAGTLGVAKNGSVATNPGEAWWTYCVMRSQDAVEVALGLDGIDAGHPVEAVCDGELAALVSQVPVTEFGDDQLRAHLEDLDWLERTARRHEAVLEAALREATIVPLRLCTLYHDQEGVRRLLRDHRVAIRDCLSSVDGCVEWGVKVFVDPKANRSEAPPEVPESGGRGATYLVRRQRERALAEKATEVRGRCVEVVGNGIGELARVSITNPPQRPEVHGRDLAMLLNGAYLVERDRTGELGEAVAALQEEWQPLGFTIELTGPWPPYNFVSGAAGVSS